MKAKLVRWKLFVWRAFRGSRATVVGRIDERPPGGAWEGGTQLSHRRWWHDDRHSLVSQRQTVQTIQRDLQRREIRDSTRRWYNDIDHCCVGGDRQRHLPVWGGQQVRQSTHRVQPCRTAYVSSLYAASIQPNHDCSLKIHLQNKFQFKTDICV